MTLARLMPVVYRGVGKQIRADRVGNETLLQCRDSQPEHETGSRMPQIELHTPLFRLQSRRDSASHPPSERGTGLQDSG